MKKAFDSKLIAPCGMNCGICISYFGYTSSGKKAKGKCAGCIVRNKNCAFIKKHCKKISNGKIQFCYECEKFPCPKLKKLDEGYKTRYGMSMIENLKEIKNKGMKNFLRNQEKKWITKKGIICVHNKKCYK